MSLELIALAEEVKESACFSHIPRALVTSMCLALYASSEDLNSGAHVCGAGTLPNEPSRVLRNFLKDSVYLLKLVVLVGKKKSSNSHDQNCV